MSLLRAGILGLVAFQIWGWLHVLAKLHNLMNGSATVESFCWKYFPIRADLHTRENVTVQVQEALSAIRDES